ncbi:hypothetical protein [Acidocella aromatica]|uniref:Uncharacterized protein n=1 Tax=Acidocella aromatica TaxID=1303579 RepID=A0A840VIQ7_9PROT|nr:hypothetical protein [Acidocella aromatica]MBB5372159.1 hypothetical protein [Acidocella aromatica]
MNKHIVAACTALALAGFGLPAYAAPSVALSSSITAHAVASPEPLTQMRHEIAVLQNEVKALQGSGEASDLTTPRDAAYNWYYGSRAYLGAA